MGVVHWKVESPGLMVGFCDDLWIYFSTTTSSACSLAALLGPLPAGEPAAEDRRRAASRAGTAGPARQR